MEPTASGLRTLDKEEFFFMNQDLFASEKQDSFILTSRSGSKICTLKELKSQVATTKEFRKIRTILGFTSTRLLYYLKLYNLWNYTDKVPISTASAEAAQCRYEGLGL